jgi:hypothetical protein
MIKKVLMPLSIAAVLGASVFTYSSFQHNEPEKTVATLVKQPSEMPVYISHGDYISYSTVDSMQKASDLVVVATPKKPFEQRKHVTTYVSDPSGQKFPETSYTVTDVTIKKVLSAKDSSLAKLKSASVVENIGIVKDNDGINKKLSFEGYEEMSNKNDYILYLTKNNNGTYSITNILNGKFDVKTHTVAPKLAQAQQEHASDHAQFEQQVKTKFKKEISEYTN